MDWTQTITIMVTTIGSVFAFYRLTRDEITVLREGLQRQEDNFNQAVQESDKHWREMFIYMNNRVNDVEKEKSKT
jgi:hypothetical protein